MLERCHDAAAYLRIVRHPQVEPFVTLGTHVTDEFLAGLAVDPENILLMAEHGCFLYVPTGAHAVYEVHTAFTPDGRGPAVVRLARESLSYMFQRTDALAIKTFVAHNNRAARRLALGVGFVPLRDVAALGTPGTEYLLTVKQWVRGLCQQQQSARSPVSVQD